MMRPDLLAYAAIPALVVSALGCEDTRAVSEQTSAGLVAKLAPLVKEDVEQVRRGLPEGATKLGAMRFDRHLRDRLGGRGSDPDRSGCCS